MGGVVVGCGEQMKEVVGFFCIVGLIFSLFNVWLFFKGLEILCICMQVYSVSVLVLVEWLECQLGIEWVYYVGLLSYFQYELVWCQQSGFGVVVSFDVKGGCDVVWCFIDVIWMVLIIINLGDIKIIIVYLVIIFYG